MIWRILIATKDYQKYVDYFLKDHRDAYISKSRSTFISNHTHIEIWPNINAIRGYRFDIIYADKEIIDNNKDLYISTMCPAIVNIDHLERRLYLKGEIE